MYNGCMKKAKSIKYAVEFPQAHDDGHAEMIERIQSAGVSYGTARSVVNGVTAIKLGTAVKVMCALGLESLDDLLNIEWE